MSPCLERYICNVLGWMGRTCFNSLVYNCRPVSIEFSVHISFFSNYLYFLRIKYSYMHDKFIIIKKKKNNKKKKTEKSRSLAAASLKRWRLFVWMMTPWAKNLKLRKKKQNNRNGDSSIRRTTLCRSGHGCGLICTHGPRHRRPGLHHFLRYAHHFGYWPAHHSIQIIFIF